MLHNVPEATYLALWSVFINVLKWFLIRFVAPTISEVLQYSIMSVLTSVLQTSLVYNKRNNISDLQARYLHGCSTRHIFFSNFSFGWNIEMFYIWSLFPVNCCSRIWMHCSRVIHIGCSDSDRLRILYCASALEYFIWFHSTCVLIKIVFSSQHVSWMTLIAT